MAVRRIKDQFSLQAWHVSLIKVNNRYETHAQGKVIRALNQINIGFATLYHFNNFFTAHADAAFPRKFNCTYIFLSVAMFFLRNLNIMCSALLLTGLSLSVKWPHLDNWEGED